MAVEADLEADNSAVAAALVGCSDRCAVSGEYECENGDDGTAVLVSTGELLRGVGDAGTADRSAAVWPSEADNGGAAEAAYSMADGCDSAGEWYTGEAEKVRDLLGCPLGCCVD